jgi:hypothetical protein
MMLVDFSLGAVIFSPSHSIFLVLFLVTYYWCNYIFTKVTGQIIYTSLQLDWQDYHSLVKIVIHFILTMFIYYLLFLVSQCRHSRLTKRGARKISRLTMRLKQHQIYAEEINTRGDTVPSTNTREASNSQNVGG